MLCRATNALISVRLIYNNLRKKYRNFCFIFCLFLFHPSPCHTLFSLTFRIPVPFPLH